MKKPACLFLTLVLAIIFITHIAGAICTTVTVTATDIWADSTVYVHQGDFVTINSSGLWGWVDSVNTGPDGAFGSSGGLSGEGTYTLDQYLQDYAEGRLIAFIGADPRSVGLFPQTLGNGYWDVGNTVQFVSDRDGELWLGFNDAAISSPAGAEDNHGSVTASVSVGSGPACDQACFPPTLSLPTTVAPLSSDGFVFIITGLPGTIWNLYQSDDLLNWSSEGQITLYADGFDGLGLNSHADASAATVAHRFYKLSNGSCCSQPIGFIRQNILPGFNLVANQLLQPDNSLNGLFVTMPDGSSLPSRTSIYKYPPGSSTPNTYTWSGSAWTDGTITVSPGEGFFIQNPGSSSFTLSLVGLVPDGSLSQSLVADNNYVSSQLPEAGGLASVLNYTPLDGDTMSLWDPISQSWTGTYAFSSSLGGWLPSEPVISVGQGLVLLPAGANTWNQTLSLCDGTTTTGDIGSTPEPGSCTSPSLSAGHVTVDAQFSFQINGTAGSYWNVYVSTDLVNWNLAEGLTIDPSGNSSFTDTSISGVDYRFYRLSNGNCCSQPIGFVGLDLYSGNNLIANQLLQSDNSLNGLFSPMPNGSTVPTGTTISKYSSGSGTPEIYTWNGYAWDGSATLSPGESFFIYNPNGTPGDYDTSLRVYFVGLVPQGTLSISVPATDYGDYVSSQLPMTGGISTILDYNPILGDTLYTYDPIAQSLQVGIRFDGDWQPPGGLETVPEPTLAVGQGVLLVPGADNVWNQSFLPCSGTNLAYTGGTPITIGTNTCNSPVPDLSYAHFVTTSSGLPLDFTFSINGPAGSTWNVLDSSDLRNWNVVGGVTLNDSGFADFDAGPSGNYGYRFYKLSNGSCCSQPIGFVRQTMVPGNNLVANQFIQMDNSVNAVFGPMPDYTYLPSGTVIYKYPFGSSTPTVDTWNGSSWTDGTVTVSPGEGFFIANTGTSPFTVTFAGLVPENSLNRTIPSGPYVISSILPEAGGITTVLGYTPADGDTLETWNPISQTYNDAVTYFAGYGWYDGTLGAPIPEPTIQAGQAFVLNFSTDNTWNPVGLSCP